MYMGTLGNRTDLFPNSEYIAKYENAILELEIPEEYFDDERFAAMMEEAEKYLATPMSGAGMTRTRPSTAPAS